MSIVDKLHRGQQLYTDSGSEERSHDFRGSGKAIRIHASEDSTVRKKGTPQDLASRRVFERFFIQQLKPFADV
tara:strand:- start:2044 stop:2262 length:219 start_codon:yes stop_codon:yes gene_type:complete